jgi:FKBP-type peptidyl-prolyl cis-trans isomerase
MMGAMKTLTGSLAVLVRSCAGLALAASLLVSAPKPAAAQPQGPNIPAPEDVKAPAATALKTKSGIASRVLKPGTGKKHPSAQDVVTVNYTGWTTDGHCFDSSEGRGPTTFPLNRVIKGWTEGVQLMVEGEKRRFWIPEELAYKGSPSSPQGMLVFDIELVSFKEGPKPPPTPPDCAAIPKDAKKTASGIGYRVLRKGTGATHPTATSNVTLHYSVWQSDGTFMESSTTGGQPATIPCGRVKGWTEALQLMVEGEKTRFWIPSEIAFAGREGAPAGKLFVFEFEILKIAN